MVDNDNNFPPGFGRFNRNRKEEPSESPEEATRKRKFVEFQKVVEASWKPVISNYLTTFGKLWLEGEIPTPNKETTQEGGEESKATSNYFVKLEVYGPIGIFTLEEDLWRERLAAFNPAGEDGNLQPQLYKLGYRCRVTLQPNGEYHFQVDDSKEIIEFKNGTQVKSEDFVKIFSEAYERGPMVIHTFWKYPYDLRNSDGLDTDIY